MFQCPRQNRNSKEPVMELKTTDTMLQLHKRKLESYTEYNQEYYDSQMNRTKGEVRTQRDDK